jgi:Ca-activated chloride channel family protein
MRFCLPFIFTLLGATNAMATDDCAADAMIVFDGSGSMAEMGFNDIDEPRIFVVYGPNGADECSGVEMRFAPEANAASLIISAINALEPGGSTALTQAVKLAAQTLDYKTQPATVVLVTDGKETCGGMPCMLAAELATDGFNTTVHVIGFKVRGTFFSWDRQTDNDYNTSESTSRCLADRTGGTYTSAETLDQLIAALRETLGCQFLF